MIVVDKYNIRKDFEPMNTPKTINIANLRPFEGHPYKVQENAEMDALVESIREHGILTPIIVRPLDGGEYEIISGHRRVYAAQKAGITEISAFALPLDRDAAAILLVDSNLHREHILPSEKAFAYKLKMDALKRQGKRTDLTSSQLATKLDSADEIGQQSGESRDKVFRYIRLTNLVPELLALVDEGKIAFTPAVELSYLTPEEQSVLLGEMELNDCTPSLSQACRLKKRSRFEGLTQDFIAGVMSEEKPNQREMLKLPMERLRQYTSKSTPKDVEDFVLKACEHYRKYLIRQRDRER